MSELARRRDARDLWVSRSHLHAAIAAASLLAVMSFAGGYALGRGKTGASEAPHLASLTDAVPGEDLVELLAQVERTAIAHPSQAMVYSDWAEGKGALPVPPQGGDAAGVEAVVGPSPLTSSIEADGLPRAKWTVEVGSFDAEADGRAVRDWLRDQAQPAFMTVRIKEGARTFWVGVGGFGSQEEAKAAATVLAPVVAGAPRSVGVPRAAEVPTADTAPAPVVVPAVAPPVEEPVAPETPDDQITD
jgi:hypothetical protein